MQKPYFKNDGFTLYLGDSMKVLGELPENYVDMIFADPPYFLSSGSFTCQNGKMVSVKKGDWDLSNGIKKNFDFHRAWIEACRRVLKPNGTIWISGTYHSIYQCGFLLQATHFHILNDIAWFKPNASPNLSCRFFTASHETLIWARKDAEAKHKFNYAIIRDWQENYKKRFINKITKKEDFIELLHESGKQMRSVWAINTPQNGEKKFGKHPTQKPLELLKIIIAASTNKGDLILDPFTGSSTTGIATQMLDRKFIGIDMEKKYLDLSVKRFNDLMKG